MWFPGKSRKSANPPTTAELGERGEETALKFLKKQHLKILAANYRCPAGEIDIIALDPSTRAQAGASTIAFVEVKTRRSDKHTDPEGAVDERKRNSIRKVARYYLAKHDPEGAFSIRFDIIAVVWDKDNRPSVRHIKEAF